MTVEELYNKLGEMLEKGEVRPTSPIWVDKGVQNYDLIERATFDVDNDLILIAEDE